MTDRVNPDEILYKFDHRSLLNTTNELAAALRQALAQRDEARKALEKLEVEGDQMYRAIVYTSGVDLNYAADEWKRAREAIQKLEDRP